jgi:hypothetical protein
MQEASIKELRERLQIQKQEAQQDRQYAESDLEVVRKDLQALTDENDEKTTRIEELVE